MVAVLTLLGSVGPTTPAWVVLTAHLGLMVSLAATFTPVWTSALGSLPPALYSHGASLFATAQQVSAAVGTTLFVGVMTWQGTTLDSAGSDASQGEVGGIRAAFLAGTLFASLIVAVALRLPRRSATPSKHAT